MPSVIPQVESGEGRMDTNFTPYLLWGEEAVSTNIHTFLIQTNTGNFPAVKLQHILQATMDSELDMEGDRF